MGNTEEKRGPCGPPVKKTSQMKIVKIWHPHPTEEGEWLYLEQHTSSGVRTFFTNGVEVAAKKVNKYGFLILGCGNGKPTKATRDEELEAAE